MDVFFYEAFEEETEALKRYLKPGIEVGFTWKTIQEQGAAAPPAALISIRTQSEIPLSWATRLSAILARTTGYDHLRAYLQATASDVSCGYLPLYCHRAVAEQAMLLWMALLRKLPQQTKQFGTFRRDGLTGEECEGKTLLVVGVGNIGHEVVRIGRGLGMEALGVDIIQRHGDVSYVSLEEGLRRANVIVCAMNLTSQNVGNFSYDVLRRAKRGVVFVNVARGEFSPAADLLRLLDEGRLGGVALDVHNRENELAVALRAGRTSSDEEFQATRRLSERPNVILTPHNAFNTREAVERKADQSIRQVMHFLERRIFLWPVS